MLSITTQAYCDSKRKGLTSTSPKFLARDKGQHVVTAQNFGSREASMTGRLTKVSLARRFDIWPLSNIFAHVKYRHLVAVQNFCSRQGCVTDRYRKNSLAERFKGLADQPLFPRASRHFSGQAHSDFSTYEQPAIATRARSRSHSRSWLRTRSKSAHP
jgi:hypothetical protein